MIQLNHGYSTKVDDAEYERLINLEWHVNINYRKDGSIRNVYAHHGTRVDGRWRATSMQRFIMGVTDPNIDVDHKNHDSLDNQRHNLRVCAEGQNNANARKTTLKRSSKFKGVSWYKDREMWGAHIRFQGKLKHLGFFADESAAAAAYDEAAARLFGEFAWTNAQEKRQG